MPRKLAPPGHMTATDAALRLGISLPMLYNHVRNGNLKRIVPPGRKQGFFLVNEVERLRADLYGFLDTGEMKRIDGEEEPAIQYHFQRTTDRQDLVGCAAIAKEVYGSEGTPVENRLEWMKKNPEILYVVKSSEMIAGYAYILPIMRDMIDEIMREEKSLADLTQDDIEAFTPGRPIDIYLMSVATLPNLDKEDKRHLSSQIISGLMELLDDLAKRGVIIRSLIARSRLADGIRLLTDMGFDEYPIESPDKRFSYFIIEVEKSKAKFVRRYKLALKKAQRGLVNGDN